MRVVNCVMDFKFDKQTIIWTSVVVIAVVVLVIVYIRSRKSDDVQEKEKQENSQNEQPSAPPSNDEQKKPADAREAFTVVMNGANQLGTIGSITGDLVATTGTTWGDAEKALIKDGRIDYADGDNGKGITLAAAGYENEEVSPLDQQMQNHNEVLRVANPDNRNYCTHEEHSQIAQMVHGGGSNTVNLFKRGTTKSLKMTIDPLGTQMVIDEKYLPEKDRHGSMKVVKNVIAGKGYDVNVERLGENLAGFSWAKINTVKQSDKEHGVVQGVGTAGTMNIVTDNRHGGAVVNKVDNAEPESVQEQFRKERFDAGKYGTVVKGNALM